MEKLLRTILKKEKSVYLSDLIDVEQHAKSTFDKLNIYNLDRKTDEIHEDILNHIEITRLKLEAFSDVKKIIKTAQEQGGRIRRKDVEEYINFVKINYDNTSDLFKYLTSKVKYFNISSLNEKLDKELAEFTHKVNLLDGAKYFLNLIFQKRNGELTKENIINLVEKLKNEGLDYRLYSSKEDIFIYDASKIRIFVIENLSDYINFLWNNFKSNINESLFYRGHASTKWELIPSIYRSNEVELEHLLYNEMIIKHPEEFNNSMTTFEKLTKMQHYELPTRLLDITTNPLVALYFACNDANSQDAEVIVFKVEHSDIFYHDSEEVSILSNLTRLSTSFNLKEMEERSLEENEFYSNEPQIQMLLSLVNKESLSINSVSSSTLRRTVFVKAKLDNKRIRAQHGAFILYGIDDNKYAPSSMSGGYIKNSKNYRIFIPSEFKESILKQLNFLDINASTIFPELDKSAIYIRNSIKSF